MTILSTIMKVESGGGKNITQGNIGDVNNRTGDLAQGYFQITGGTWAQFGGLNTGFTSAIQAPYATQVQIAQNIPVQRWGPDTQNALAAAGYQPMRGETLGAMMNRYGESPGDTVAGDGSTATGSGTTLAHGPADQSSGLNAGAAGGAGAAGSASSLPPGAGSPITVGLQPAATQDIQTWVNSFETSVGNAFSGALTSALKLVGIDFAGIQNWFVRAGVIILGIVILAAGVIGLMWDHGGSDVVKKYGPVLSAA